MADMDAFLARLDDQLNRLKSWQEELDSEAKQHREEIARLKARRSARLAELAAGLLPDLQQATLDRLNDKLPGSLSSRQVSDLRAEHVQALQTQTQDLLAKFDPATVAARRLRLENDLEQEKGYQDTVEASLRNRMAIPGIQTLIDRGYGTARYRQSWLSRDFYRHWKRADEIVELLKVKDWAEVLAKVQELKDNSARIAASRADLEKQIADLDRNQQYYDELNGAAQHVEEALLEKARTKLSGLMDTLSRRPDWMSDLQDIDTAITAHQKAVDEGLQARREQISTQSAQLQDVRLNAVRSRRREVPDDYLTSLPTVSRGVPLAPGPTTVIINSGRSDSLFTDFLLYGAMMEFFSPPARYGQGSGYSSLPGSSGSQDWSSSVSESRVGRLS